MSSIDSGMTWLMVTSLPHREASCKVCGLIESHSTRWSKLAWRTDHWTRLYQAYQWVLLLSNLMRDSSSATEFRLRQVARPPIVRYSEPSGPSDSAG